MAGPEGSNPYPDNVYFDGRAVSWVGIGEEGHEARFGVIQDGFHERFTTPDNGERIWLWNPTQEQVMIVEVLDEESEIMSAHALRGDGVIDVWGGRDIYVITPEGQGEVAYMCEYGREPADLGSLIIE